MKRATTLFNFVFCPSFDTKGVVAPRSNSSRTTTRITGAGASAVETTPGAPVSGESFFSLYAVRKSKNIICLHHSIMPVQIKHNTLSLLLQPILDGRSADAATMGVPSVQKRHSHVEGKNKLNGQNAGNTPTRGEIHTETNEGAPTGSEVTQWSVAFQVDDCQTAHVRLPQRLSH